MTAGPVNRALLESNYQSPGQVYDDAKTEGAFNVLANQIDDNWTTFAATVPSGALTYLRTTADTTYYVSSTGSDLNDGLSPGAPLQTIMAAINKIPQIVNHTMNIVVSSSFGYNETVTIVGRVGSGSLSITGGAAVSDSYPVVNMLISQCGIAINITGMKAFTTTGDAFVVSRCIQVVFNFCKAADTALGFSGFHIFASNVIISNNFIANKGGGISARESSTVASSTNSGSGNINALFADGAATIGKLSTQPTGTNNESTSGGGVIR